MLDYAPNVKAGAGRAWACADRWAVEFGAPGQASGEESLLGMVSLVQGMDYGSVGRMGAAARRTVNAYCPERISGYCASS